MSLKEQLVKSGIISQKEVDEKEEQERNERILSKQQWKKEQELRNKQDASAYFFYKRKATSCTCPICKSSIGDIDIPEDIIKVNSFLDLNNLVKNKRQGYSIAEKIVKNHLDKVVSFIVRFNNGKIKISICAECISNNLMNTKYFVDPQRNDKNN